MNANDTGLAKLKDVVEKFGVCWKVWPEFTYVRDEKRQIGYELELAGTHEAETHDADAGCEACLRVFSGLQEIARWILPQDEPSADYELGPFDQSLRFSAQHQNRPDVTLSIKVLHRHDYESPVDQSEDHCLAEMKQRLREIGVSEASATGLRASR